MIKFYTDIHTPLENICLCIGLWQKNDCGFLLTYREKERVDGIIWDIVRKPKNNI